MARPTAIRPVGQRNKFLNMLVYGPPGIGKTRLAGTSEAIGKTLILECGTGETDTNAAAGQEVDVWEINNRRDIEEAEEYLRHEGYDEYAIAWVDGLSQLEGRIMKEIMRGVAEKPNRMIELPDKPEYLKTQNIMDLLVTQFVALPMHVGFTAHVMMENVPTIDKDGDEVQVTMLLPQVQGGRGKLSQKLCGYMNVVGYLSSVPVEVDGEESFRQGMLVQSSGKNILSKDRFDVLGNADGYMISPTMPKVMKAIEGKLIGTKAPAKKAGAKKVAKKTAMPVKKTASKAAALRRK